MLASMAIAPVDIVLARKPKTSAAPPPVARAADPERRALIEEIESMEGVALTQAPMLFRLVLICGAAICGGVGGGVVLGVADLLGRLV